MKSTLSKYQIINISAIAKKLMFTVLLTIISAVHAQVIIGDAIGTAPTKTSVLLEFAKNQNKGIIVPYVRTLPTAAALVGGSIILDATTSTNARMKFYNGTSWVDMSGQGANVTSVLINQPINTTETTNSKTIIDETNSKTIIGAATSSADGVLVLESPNLAMVLPTVADVQNIPSPSPGMMVYVSNKSGAKRLAVYNGNKWSFWQN